jgi:hypothetical protein
MPPSPGIVWCLTGVVPVTEEHMTDVHIFAIDRAKRSLQVCATALGTMYR